MCAWNVFCWSFRYCNFVQLLDLLDFYQGFDLIYWIWSGLLRDPWTARRSSQSILKKSALNIHWKDWYWNWNSNTLATWCEEVTHWKRPWCLERLKARRDVDDRGWNGWMASPTQWTWIWVNSRSWWWTGRPGVLQSMGSQRVGHDWMTKLTDLLNLLTSGNVICKIFYFFFLNMLRFFMLLLLYSVIEKNLLR